MTHWDLFHALKNVIPVSMTHSLLLCISIILLSVDSHMTSNIHVKTSVHPTEVIFETVYKDGLTAEQPM